MAGLRDQYAVIRAHPEHNDPPVEYIAFEQHQHEGGALANLAGSTKLPNGTYKSGLMAIATLDGCIRLQEGTKPLWELQVDHQLFSACMVAGVTKGYDSSRGSKAGSNSFSGKDVVVACALDGMTYIVDEAQNVVRFRYEDKVCAFVAGNYSMRKGEKVPCFVYVTFSDRIHLYYDVRLPSIPAVSIYQSMADHFQDFSVLKESQESVDWTLAEQTSLIYSCANHSFDTADQQRYRALLLEKLRKIQEENECLEQSLNALHSTSGFSSPRFASPVSSPILSSYMYP